MNVMEQFNPAEQAAIRTAFGKRKRKEPLTGTEELLIKTYAKEFQRAKRAGYDLADLRHNPAYRAWLKEKGQDCGGFDLKLYRQWKAERRSA